MLAAFWLEEQLLASQEGLCCMEMFSSPLTLCVSITVLSPFMLFRVNITVYSECYMDTNTLEQYIYF
jgi:hypothetical protein